MANNRHLYGFRYYSNIAGGGIGPATEYTVASGYAPTPAATATGIVAGDPVEFLTNGTLQLMGDTALTGLTTGFGVVAGINNAKVDPNGRARPTSFYPSGTTYATKATETRLAVLPFGRVLWQIDVNDNTTATTEAAYKALIGEFCGLTYSPDTADANKPKANPLLNISSHTVTASADVPFQIMGISKTAENVDFSGTFVKLLVMLRFGAEPVFNSTAGF